VVFLRFLINTEWKLRIKTEIFFEIWVRKISPPVFKQCASVAKKSIGSPILFGKQSKKMCGTLSRTATHIFRVSFFRLMGIKPLSCKARHLTTGRLLYRTYITKTLVLIITFSLAIIKNSKNPLQYSTLLKMNRMLETNLGFQYRSEKNVSASLELNDSSSSKTV
jgi:hypothetical protein